MKNNFKFLGLLFLYNGLLFSSCKKSTFYVKNPIIIQQIDTFVKSGIKNSDPFIDKNTPVLVYISEGKKNYPYEFNLLFIKPHSCRNLIGYINRNDRFIYFYAASNINVSNYFGNINKYNCDSTMLRKVLKFEMTEWYNELLYFDGSKFKRWNEL